MLSSFSCGKIGRIFSVSFLLKFDSDSSHIGFSSTMLSSRCEFDTLCSRQPQLWRIIRSVGKYTVLHSCSGTKILSIRISTAAYPLLKYTKSIVVSGERDVTLSYQLLKPTTATSSGTENPRRQSCSTPSAAIMSDAVTIASISFFPCMSKLSIRRSTASSMYFASIFLFIITTEFSIKGRFRSFSSFLKFNIRRRCGSDTSVPTNANFL